VELTDELDLHTFHPRDVAELVPDYLDEAIRLGFERVRIIHGKGRGTLRRMVHEALERHPGVVSFRLGDQTSGSWGATVVELDVGGRGSGDALVATIGAAIDIDIDGDSEIAGKSIIPATPAENLRERRDGLLAEIGKLAICETVGVGGRGVVRRAEQSGLRRDVAVKTVRGEADDAAVVELLAEALITGSLEHPNIVPVHDIGVGDDGAPFIVLKKIEGVTWDELIAGAGLERNLAILADVIDAVRFAHSRRIIHRDLKPANVMVGEFGEVYVLDWGLAASLDDDAEWLSRVSQIDGVAGTLGYMAPEMLAVGVIDERTDVYLLGALLYEIAVGRPPHRGRSFAALAESITRSEPELGDEVPAKLAAIIRRAMHADPAERFASVDALKEAIESFGVHRDAQRLVASTGERLAALIDACAAPEPDRKRLYNLFGECRFGFREALRRWPESLDAREGLERAVRALVDHELERGDPPAAERLLAELASPPADLRDRVAAELARRRDRLESLEKLEADLDPSIGRRGRGLGIVIVGLVAVGTFGLTPLLLPAVVIAPRWPTLLAITLVGGVPLAIGIVLLREQLVSTRPNRLLGLAIAIAWVGTVAMVLGLWLAGAEPEMVRVGHPIIWFCCTGMLAGGVDRRLWPAAIVFFAAALVVPTLGWLVSFYALLGSLLLMVLNVVWITLRPLRV
jgi:serine/threonine-protein kinase